MKKRKISRRGILICVLSLALAAVAAGCGSPERDAGETGQGRETAAPAQSIQGEDAGQGEREASPVGKEDGNEVKEMGTEKEKDSAASAGISPAGSKTDGPDGVSLEAASLAMEKYMKNFYVEEDGSGEIAGEQFWPRAEILEILVDAFEKTGDAAYLELFDGMYEGFVRDYRQDWSSNDFNDDIMWMTIACARAYQAGGKDTYRQQAERHFNLVYDRAFSDDLGGGLFWKTDNTTKNSCINGPAAIAACLLYQITGEQAYLDKALAIYDWQCENLLGPTGAVYDAWDLEKGINEWCSTYNQGTFIGASVYLYQILGEERFLENAVLAADYTMNDMYAQGVINTEDEGNDLPGFKGILARWMGKLVHECGQEQYLPWMEKNARTAWENRNSKDIMWTKWADQTQDTFYTAWGCSAGVSLLWSVLPPAEL